MEKLQIVGEQITNLERINCEFFVRKLISEYYKIANSVSGYC